MIYDDDDESMCGKRETLRTIAAFGLETDKRNPWMSQAVCANGPTGWWDVEAGRPVAPLNDGPQHRWPRLRWQDLPDPALLMCGWCPVWAECLAWAETTGDVWSIAGGMTPDQRRTARELAEATSDAA